MISAAEARSFVESGDLTMLGILSEERNAAFPDVPTCREQGYDCVWGTWRGMAVPLGTDPAVVEVLEKACAAAVEDPDFVATMANLGQTISYMNSADYTAFLASETENVPAAMEAVGLLDE